MNSRKKSKHNFGLPRNKILRKGDIKQVLNSGIKESGAYLNIYHQNSNEEKFAVLVSKQSGNAVDRNRGKRVAREIYRSNPSWFHEMRIVFLLKQVNLSYSAIKNEIKKLLRIQ